jgi:predicted methyltransferase
MKTLWFVFLGLGLFVSAQAGVPLQAAVENSARTPAFVTRDVWRHPYETLSFFGIEPNSTVVELSPGGGWYTEILAPFVHDQGQLILGLDDPMSINPESMHFRELLDVKFKAHPQIYDKVVMGVFAPFDKLDYAHPVSVDVVLTFRNIHNWMSAGDSGVRQVFASVFRSLKSGGVFGVVEHRLPEDRVQDPKSSSGYVHTSYVIELAKSVGFKLEASSEINANPKDHADHPGGVWALPPSFVNKEVNKSQYQAIGESDRMTLKFVKP